MKASTLKYFIISLVASLISLIIVVMPFHGFLTVWASTIDGHYTALRLWKEALLLLCVIGALYLVLFDSKVRSRTMTRRLMWLLLAYSGWILLRALIAHLNHTVTDKALAYGVLVDLRFLVFFLVAWLLAVRTTQLPAQWQRLLLWPAYGVIGFALLQAFILPHDFLSHFGYNEATTIPPFETINNNSQYIRVSSTMRGPNPFGAYLLIPISLLMVYILTPLKRNRSHLVILPLALVALYFTYSRSAWLGALAALVVVLAIRFGNRLLTTKRLALVAVALVVIVSAGLALRTNHRFENIVLHTQTNSTSAQSSNQGHLAALKNGVSDLVHQPFGRGPGTAGPASVYNDGKTRLAEDYYIQLGQEAGWLAIGLFLLINFGVGYLLWSRRADPLALSLLAALVGLTVVNLLSHAWSDDTLTYVWWGLAGIAMAQPATAELAEASSPVKTPKPSKARKPARQRRAKS
ncbi:MAG: O-antigen ligase family protein [Candidatus Saccharimonadales bacterium]